ncbi:MAG TPA: DUF4382 domain-containing protein [Planctomycetota bacterium]|jgi:hypothetical protein|nr:DUF4382 domain-containing protein [Planctomycetota bacterium]
MQFHQGLTRTWSFLLLAIASGVAACSGGGGGGGGGGTGTLDLSATDDAFVYDIVQEASISVDRITILHDADSDDGPITLYDGAPILLDLFNLRDGVTQHVDLSVLPVGDYRQLRLHVSAARLVLVNGNVYTTEDGTIHLTSQDTSGFKVVVDPPIEIVRDQRSDVLLDFDLTQTFHPIPANDPLNATTYSLHPVIHVTNLGHTGGIQGVVTQDDGAGGLTPVDQATVYIMPPGQTDPTMSVATTGTATDGSYTVLAIEPGTYDVIAVKGALSGTVPGIVVVVGSVATADVTIH